MNIKLSLAVAVGVLSAAPALATTVTLDFDGVTNAASIEDFYNGGADSAGASSGLNYGISFGPDALGFTNELFAPTGYLNAVDSDAAMNVDPGFIGVVSFDYASFDDFQVNVYSGPNGTGDVLATFLLAANFTEWEPISVTVNEIARSIQFGDAVSFAAFDNVSVNVVPLPAAAWLLLSALGGFAAFVRRPTAA